MLSARATAELAALAEALEVPVAHTLMGKGCLREDHPLLLGHDRLLGHADRQREVPHGRSHPRRRHAARRSELELVGSALHVRDSADAADPHRRRSRRDRPQSIRPSSASSPTRSSRSARSRTAAQDAGASRSRPAARGASPAGAASSRTNWADQWTSNQFPLRPERILSELRKAVPEDGFIVTDVGWNKNGVAQQFPDHRARHVHHAERTRDDGLRPGRGARREARAAAPRGGRARRRWRVQRQSDRSSPPRWKPDCHVVWVVMDNAGVRHDRGPRERCTTAATFGCMFERDGKPYRVDYAAMARACGARRRHDRVGGRSRPGAARGAGVEPPDRDPGADGKRADADAGPLEHQRHLPQG